MILRVGLIQKNFGNVYLLLFGNFSAYSLGD